MNVWPVIQRELRVQARAPATWWLRFAGVALAITIFGMIAFDGGSSSYAGQSMFYGLHSFACFGIVTICPLLASDCISREKREGTLPLLLLSCLSPRDVVYGKVAAHAMRAYLIWLAVVPVLCLPLLLGGISGGQVALMLTVEVGLIGCSLSSGVLASAMSLKPAIATIAAYVVVMVSGMFCGMMLIPVGAMVAGISGSMSEEYGLAFGALAGMSLAVGTFLIHIHSAGSHVQLFGTGWINGNYQPPPYTPPMPAPVTIPAPAPPRPGVGRRYPYVPGGYVQQVMEEWQERRQARRMEKCPFIWLLCRGRGEGSREYFAFILVLLVAYFGFMTFLGSGSPEWIFVLLLMAMTAVASRNLMEERQSGMLELLSVTPMPMARLGSAQMSRFRHVFLPPVALCAGMVVVHDLLAMEMPLKPLLAISLISLFTLPAIGLALSLHLRYAITASIGMLLLAWLIPWGAAALAWKFFGEAYDYYREPAIAWSAGDIAFAGTHAFVGCLAWWMAQAALNKRDFLHRSVQ